MWSGIFLMIELARAARPIFIFHGLKEHSHDFNDFRGFIERRAPGTIVHYADVFNGASSFEALPKQHLAYTKEFLKFSQKYPDGINVVAFSQGGLIARCVLQSNNHNVHTFVAISSPLNGQFGETEYLRKKYIKVNKFNLYKYLYRKRGQLLSIANYWRDPYHLDEYAAASEYLAIYNGETQKTPINPAWAENFSHLKQLVTIGGPQDGVIEPWQSSQFMNFRTNSTSISDVEEFEFFKMNNFGLKTLQENGRWKKHVQDGVNHHQWIRNESIFDNYVWPYLREQDILKWMNDPAQTESYA